MSGMNASSVSPNTTGQPESEGKTRHGSADVVELAPACEYFVSEGLLKLINHPAELILHVSSFTVDVSEAFRVSDEENAVFHGKVYFDRKKLRIIIRWEGFKLVKDIPPAYRRGVRV
jgi:hypothetical protein